MPTPVAADIPFAPRRLPFFYGWAILGFGTVGILASTPGQTIGVATFTDYLIDALGLQRQTLSLAYAIGTAASSLLLTYAGKLYDRFGARVMGVLTPLALSVVLVALSQADRIAAPLGGALAPQRPWVAAFAVMVVGFFALRFTGQGVLTMVSRNMMLKWFDRHRGLAVGISGVFVAVGFSLTPLIFAALLDGWGWRGAWLWAAAVVGPATAALAAVFFRDNPEQCGLVPDGHAPPPHPHDTPGPPAAVMEQYTLGQARRCFAFWVFAVAIAMFALYITGLMFHIDSIFAEAGMGKNAGRSIFLPAAVLSLLFRLLAGWISDHVPLKYLLMVFLGGMAGTMFGFLYLEQQWTIWLIIAGNGVSLAMMDLLSGMVWPRFFGREHLGAISGQAMAVAVLFSAVGPYLFAISLDWTASYDAAAGACLGAIAVLMALSPLANNPQAGRAGAGL